MGTKDIIMEEVKKLLEHAPKAISERTAEFIVDRLEAVDEAAAKGENAAEVMQQALVNINLKVASEVVEAADAAAYMWWRLFWRMISLSLATMIQKM